MKKRRMTWIIIIALIILLTSGLVYFVTKDSVLAVAMATAIATVTLAIINFLYLKEIEIGRSESLNREINEKIYSRLLRQLEAFLKAENHTQEDMQSVALPLGWDWDGVKYEQFHLAYKIPKEIFNQLNDFSKIFNEYKKFFEQLIKEIKKTTIIEFKKVEPSIDIDSFWGVEFYFPTKRGGSYFKKMFESLFFQKNIQESIKKFKSENSIDSCLICEFLDNGHRPLSTIKNEQEIIQFFESVFKHLRDNSVNLKEILRLRESGMGLAQQILTQISPE